MLAATLTANIQCPHQLEQCPGAQRHTREAAARPRTQAPGVAVIGALYAHARARRDFVRLLQRVVGHLDHVPGLVAGLTCGPGRAGREHVLRGGPMTCVCTAQASTHPRNYANCTDDLRCKPPPSHILSLSNPRNCEEAAGCKGPRVADVARGAVRTLLCADHGARLADALICLGIVHRDAARADVLVPGAAHNLKVLQLRAARVDLRLVCLAPPQHRSSECRKSYRPTCYTQHPWPCAPAPTRTSGGQRWFLSALDMPL